MDIGYSLRQASKNSGIPITTLGNFHRKLGIIAPDVKDKKGELTLYSDAQINLAKDYYEKNIRRRGTKVTVEKNNSVDSVNESRVDDSTPMVTLETRANKIRQLQADVNRGIIEIGYELIEAKKEIPHGQWENWLDTEFEWTDRTARYFMAVAERYGNRKTFSDFKPSILQAMLSLPAGDEDAFIAEQAATGNPIENQSVREVKEHIKNWNQRNEQVDAEFMHGEDLESSAEPITDSLKDSSEELTNNDKVINEVEVISEESNVSDSISPVIEEAFTAVEEPVLDSSEKADTLPAQVDPSVNSVTHKTKTKRPFNLDDCRRQVNKHLETVKQFITESGDEQVVKTILDYLMSLRTDITNVISLGDEKLASSHKPFRE